ncbi:helix-hairpin-helix domain-containing protein [Adlercreutzia shanghongiae]|uniref:Helix-hairpin-helix domain-containing protein n=1 Tax=Adlercreutzia shanghongiae TaxID=3111773 RepID=A0ABU6IXJ4_9ACTN|nr:helix-hairpin-helix domain-containing protein [Adlercreutzia sp. R22]MEC4294249.1 helix-hairpin-helix domain-containing protein [Adlercreutzia sp. R22]
MAFQEQAESLRAKLHLAAVPKPVFAGLVTILLLVVLVSGVLVAGASGGETFEITRQETSAELDGLSEDAFVQQAAPPSSVGDVDDSTSVVIGEAQDTEPAKLCVHVDGCVGAPGVYYLNEGSRIIDAVQAAGGAGADAETAAVNLAEVVQDGQQIVIPSKGEGSNGLAAASSDGAASSGSSSGGLVSINRASAAELQTLKGIGEATAEKIIAEREANGPFKSIDDLIRVSGIGEKKLEALRDGLCL